MSYCTCGCGRAAKPAAITMPAVSADTTIEETKRHAGAPEVLQFGLNHCCGAHLTLRESAASAGVRVEDVLEALAQVGGRA